MIPSSDRKPITVLVSPGVKTAFEQLLRARGLTSSAYLRAFIEAQLEKIGKHPDRAEHEATSESADELVATGRSALVQISVLVPSRVKTALERRLRSSGSTPSAYLRSTVTAMLEKAGDLEPAAEEAPLAGGPRPRVRVGERDNGTGQRVEITLAPSVLVQVERDRTALGLTRAGWLARAVRTVLLGRPQLVPAELASIKELGEVLERWRVSLDELDGEALSGRDTRTVVIDPGQLATIVGCLDAASSTVGRVIGEHDRRWRMR